MAIGFAMTKKVVHCVVPSHSLATEVHLMLAERRREAELIKLAFTPHSRTTTFGVALHFNTSLGVHILVVCCTASVGATAYSPIAIPSGLALSSFQPAPSITSVAPAAVMKELRIAVSLRLEFLGN
ncbi:hypothetical protein J1614_012114 [Plenodomus biglobosus]|nr:hypothetical protein J1614_012114 [Plenodomus biglobosus]